MEAYDDVKDFLDYTIEDEDADRYNKALPFGGIRDDAPEDVKKAYEDYVKRSKEALERGFK